MPVRGTQSLVQMLAVCWSRPGLLIRELLWRWSFGILALGVVGYEGMRLFAAVPLSQTGIGDFSLTDPMGSLQLVLAAVAVLLPPVLKLALWLSPLLMIAWAVFSGLGRSVVLKHLDPAMRSVPGSLIVLQLLRAVAQVAICAAWFLSIRWAAAFTLSGPEPNLVGYFAWVICLSLGIFTLWALLSWVFLIAPILAMLEGTGVFGSLVRSLRLGPLTAKLVEVNLVMNIVKLALIVLTMVFSVLPMAFGTGMPSGVELYLWWGGGSLLYLAASDFFQVARLAVFIQFWHRYYPHAIFAGHAV